MNSQLSLGSYIYIGNTSCWYITWYIDTMHANDAIHFILTLIPLPSSFADVRSSRRHSSKPRASRHHKSNGHHLHHSRHPRHPPLPPTPVANLSSSAEDLTSSEHVYDVPECEAAGGGGDDFLAIYETLDRVQQSRRRGRKGNSNESDLKSFKSHSMEALETPTPSLKSFEFPTPGGGGGTASEEEGAVGGGRRSKGAMSSPEEQAIGKFRLLVTLRRTRI